MIVAMAGAYCYFFPLDAPPPRPKNDIFKLLAKKNSGIVEIGDDIGDAFLYDDLPNDDLKEYIDLDDGDQELHIAPLSRIH